MFREDLHGDVGAPCNGRVYPTNPVRPCTLDDIPWLAELLGHTYGGYADLKRCEQYYRSTLGRKDHVYLRGDMSAAGAKYFVPYWAPLDSRPLASDVFFCAKPGKVAALVELSLVMKEVVQWARRAGCAEASFAAFNGADISGLARRAGADDTVPMFRAVF